MVVGWRGGGEDGVVGSGQVEWSIRCASGSKELAFIFCVRSQWEGGLAETK